MRPKLALVLLVAGVLLAARWLVSAGVILAQPQAQLLSATIDGPLPLTDPEAAVWEQAPAVEVVMTSQTVARPVMVGPVVPVITVRSLNDGQWISFLVEWRDETRDVRAIGTDQFRDAAALQFSLDPDVPGICMGTPQAGMVNLWHWKADWQEDIDVAFQDVLQAYPNMWKDVYPFVAGEPPFVLPRDFDSDDARRYLAGLAAGNPLSQTVRATPVEELIATGYGRAESHSEQRVLGRGVWRDGRWRVVFSRLIAVDDPAAVRFQDGSRAYVAFAVWDGSAGQVGARKQVSTDLTLAMGTVPARSRSSLAGGALVVLAVLAVAGAWFVAGRRRHVRPGA